MQTVAIEGVRNPRWSNEENTIINLEVNFSHMPEEWVDFTASPNDTTSYGPALYQLATEGRFGPIAAFQEVS